jgi:hypothetical protein
MFVVKKTYYLILLGMLLLAPGAWAQTTGDIKLVQAKLSAYGAGTADGRMGNNTRNAIKAYQRDWQIAETGDITAELIAMLKGEHDRTKPQWVKLPDRDCYFWKGAPEPRGQVSWAGECKDRKIDGKGLLVYRYIANGVPIKETQKGEFRLGIRHGYGEWTSPRGGGFKGQYANHDWNGRGVLTLADGNKYVGEFRNNKYHGQGVLTWADGDKYEGEWRDGKKHGQGVYTSANGDKYDGEFRNNKYHGQGVRTWADGDKYVGEFRNDKPHGRGTFITADSTREVRRWRKGCSNLNGHTRWIHTTKQACGF